MGSTTQESKRGNRALAIAIAMALALGIGSTAQAQQYGYPAAASSSDQAAHGRLKQNRDNERNDRYHAPNRNGGHDAPVQHASSQQGYPAAGGNGYGYGNGTVHPIVAHPGGHGGRLAIPDEPRHEPARGYPQGGGSYGYGSGTVQPIRAHEPAPQRYRPAESDQRATGNPSMQRGEACPPGECGHPAPRGNNDTGRSGYAYGATEQAREAPSKVQRGDERGVHAGAGYGAVAPSIGQSRTGAGSRGSVGAGTHFGQSGATTVTGPNGQKQSFGGATTVGGLDGTPGHSREVTGLNGKKTTVGGAGSVEGLHGTIYQNGVTYRPGRDANGVNAQGDHQGGVHLNNGGMAGVSDSPSDSHGSNKKHSVQKFGDVTIRNKDGSYSSKPPKGSASGSASAGSGGGLCNWFGIGCGSKATTKVEDPKTVHFKGHKEGGVGDDPDVGDNGGGTLVSGTGKRVNPGHRPGQDSGGGQGTEGSSTKGNGSARNNATGAYVVTNKNGQDLPVKPKVNGALKSDSNGIKGVTDPKRGGSAGGGGG